MPYVPVPKDMSKVKVKVMFGLTKRQIICFGAGAVVGVPLYFLFRGALGNSFAMVIMVAAMSPFFFMGMYEKNGLSAEKIIRNILWTKLNPGIRPYKEENLYNYLTEKEVRSVGGKDTKDAKRRGEKGTAAAQKVGGK
jgi:hypothetical protein